MYHGGPLILSDINMLHTSQCSCNSEGLASDYGRNQTWTRVCVGYIRTPNKNQKPKGMSKAEFARLNRALFNAQMDVLLKPLRVYQRTGVLMQLPGRDGETHTSVVVPRAAMCSYDQPEADLVTGKKGAYKMMPMMCSM